MSESTLSIDRESLSEICQSRGITLLILFGSYARETQHQQSDIDLAYKRKDPFSFDEKMEFKRQIGDILLKESVPIDLVYIPHADPLLLRKISESAELLSGKEKDFQSFLRRAFHRSADFKPYFIFERERLKKRLREISTK